MEPTAYISPTPFYKKRLFLIFLFIVILILIPLSFYIFKTYFLKAPAPKPTEVSSEVAIKAEELPIALDILQNPMVYEWRGSVSGTLIARDGESITISDDKGDTIKILVDLNQNYSGTRFYKKKPSDDPKKDFVLLDDIPIGTTLGGDFFVFPHQKNQIVGSSFIVDIE